MAKLVNRLPHWLILLSIALPLRLVNLGSESLWFDEAFTARLASPGADFWGAILGDNHPPLWPALQAINMRVFGASEFSFRWLAMLFSLGCVLLVWRIALVLKMPRNTALLAGIFVSILPASIYYAQDGRQYALFAFGVLGMVWALLRSNYYLFVPFSIVAIYSQNVGLIYTFVLGQIALLIARNWSQRLKLGLALSVVVLAWAPWASVVISQTKAVGEFFWLGPFTPLSPFWFVAMNTFGWRMADNIQLHIYAIAYAWSILGIWAFRKQLMTKQGLIILGAVFGAPALLALISATWQNIYVYRALLPTVLLLMVCWAWAFNHLGRANRNVLRVVGTFGLMVGIVAHYFPVAPRANIPGLLEPIAAEPVKYPAYFLDATSAITIGRYYPDNMLQVVRPERGNIVTVAQSTRRAMGLIECDLDCLRAKTDTFYLFFVESPFSTNDCWREFRRVMLEAKHVDLVKIAHDGEMITTYIYKVRL